MKTRGSGILLHITSLATKFGIGDLGPSAHQFAEFLHEAGQRYWQILPLHPTESRYDNSPYHALSAFAGNPLLISPELLAADGFLDRSDIVPVPSFPFDKVDFSAVIAYKNRLFDMAYHRFAYFGSDPDFFRFCEEQSGWLDDYALFIAIRNQYPDTPWSDWPSELKNRDLNALNDFKGTNRTEIEQERFLQYLFSLQWAALLKKCRELDIWLIGDIPIYVDFDSSDVWTNPHLFQLNKDKEPLFIAGVPPDYFSATGQIWNSPLYNWDEIEKSGFLWWIKRMEHELKTVDFLRIDHFRGLVGFWEIKAGSETAIDGRWVSAPVWELLRSFTKKFPCLPIIAEDLGIITPDVREVMREFSIPGMKVLAFAFSSDTAENPYILHNITKNSVIYTGTHDNTPTQGWFTDDATWEEKQRLSAYFGRDITAEEINDVFIRMALMSSANTAIIPMQDILHLGSLARMNKPGTDSGNWGWKMHEEMITEDLSFRLRSLAKIYGRI